MENNNNIGRRNFLKLLGGSAVATSATLAGCSSGKEKVYSDEDAYSGEVPIGKMTYRINSNTKDKVSLLGYGCMRWPTKEENDQEVDEEMVYKLVDYAIEHGVNYFDTAPVYTKGLSEHYTGNALARHPRNSYYIATKMSNFDPELQTREASIAMYHNSMKELHTDYFDYYLLHSIGEMEGYKARFLNNGILDFLLKEREAGRIRNLGWSFHGNKEFFDYVLNCGVKWDFVQIELNYFDWKHASGENVNADYLYGELTKRNIPSVIMEPLRGGSLSKLNYASMAKLKEINSKATCASWAFRYAGTFDHVLTVLSGMTYMEHLQDNIRTYSPLVPVTEQQKELLEKVALMILQYPLIDCTGCNYCMPCPYRLDIPGIFAHYNKFVNDGTVPQNLQDKNYRRDRRNFLLGYNRAIPAERQADHCVNCHKCEPLCPQHIDIPREMQRINRFVEALKQDKPITVEEPGRG